MKIVSELRSAATVSDRSPSMQIHRRIAYACAYAYAYVSGCGGASPELGYGTELAVPGAQFRPGRFPAATGGPPTLSVSSTNASVIIGNVHAKLHGVLDPAASGAIVGIAGSDGAWILPAGPPDTDTPNSASLDALFGLDAAMPAGPFTLVLAATDRDGRIGDAGELMLTADDAPPPTGDLVVGLSWDSSADLDLHVVDPDGGEAWSGQPNTWRPPPPGEPSDPFAYLTGGILDHDGNASCHRDGVPREDVIWTTRMATPTSPPIAPVIPSGTYTVRVDTRSLCTDASASWYVAVYAEGVVIAAARGVSTSEDVLAPHGANAGVTAVTFEQP